jgi:hypothetical protein
MMSLDIDDDKDEETTSWMPIAIPSCGFDFPMGMGDAYNFREF